MGPHDHPFYEVAANAKSLSERGDKVFQKYTCGRCGERKTMTVPNTFYKTGECDTCGYVTDIVESGCNFLVVRMLP